MTTSKTRLRNGTIYDGKGTPRITPTIAGDPRDHLLTTHIPIPLTLTTPAP